jgi:hypothetical protein
MIDTAQDVSNDTIGSEGIFLRTADRWPIAFESSCVRREEFPLGHPRNLLRSTGALAATIWGY